MPGVVEKPQGRHTLSFVCYGHCWDGNTIIEAEAPLGAGSDTKQDICRCRLLSRSSLTSDLRLAYHYTPAPTSTRMSRTFRNPTYESSSSKAQYRCKGRKKHLSYCLYAQPMRHPLRIVFRAGPVSFPDSAPSPIVGRPVEGRP